MGVAQQSRHADRAKILIDLAFHIATQDISEVNHQDSTSMNAIAIVALVFLPGTLFRVCSPRPWPLFFPR